MKIMAFLVKTITASVSPVLCTVAVYNAQFTTQESLLYSLLMEGAFDADAFSKSTKYTSSVQKW